jgi:DNA primase
VFGTDLQQADWQSVIVVEGVFDALSINGVAVLHADINDAQARLIRSLGREVIVVPDQDEAGMRLVERAVELGWSVSMPNWPEGVKDVNDAVIKLGKLSTLLTIMQARETSKIKIELRKKQLVKRLRT